LIGAPIIACTAPHLGRLPHTVTADGSSFKSHTLNNGATFQVTFSKAGTFSYDCEYHGGPGERGCRAWFGYNRADRARDLTRDEDAEVTTLKEGDVLGPYELVAEIGRGGMAVVYQARQPSLQRFVALKVLSPTLAGDPVFVGRFRREATITAGLDHPHIVPIFDVGQADGVPYIAMRFIPGPSLAQVLRQDGFLSLERTRLILEQVASALDYAHARGVVHRDVKPGNILVESGDQISLVDFGIARAEDVTQVTRAGAVLGTLTYMAPEQIQGQRVDYRTDLYALGIIAYELLAGARPSPRPRPRRSCIAISPSRRRRSVRTAQTCPMRSRWPFGGCWRSSRRTAIRRRLNLSGRLP
jgi:serine/threonine protein kinase